MSDDSEALARIAVALERLADRFAPPPPQPWKAAACVDGDFCCEGPGDDVDAMVAAHTEETGHTIKQGKTYGEVVGGE